MHLSPWREPRGLRLFVLLALGSLCFACGSGGSSSAAPAGATGSGATVSGKVTAKSTGAPITEFSVLVFPAGSALAGRAAAPSARYDFSDAAGEFRLANLVSPNASLVVVPVASDLAPSAALPVGSGVINAGLDGGVALSGRIVTDTDTPVSGATVQLEERWLGQGWNLDPATVTSDSAGVFTMPRLRPGYIASFLVEHATYGVQRFDVAVDDADPKRSVELVLTTGATTPTYPHFRPGARTVLGAAAGQSVTVTLTPADAATDWNLQVVSPSGQVAAASYLGAGLTDTVSFTAAESGHYALYTPWVAGSGGFVLDSATPSVSTPLTGAASWPTGSNPSGSALWAKMKTLGATYEVPPEIIAAVAYEASGWRQWNADGSFNYSSAGWARGVHTAPGLGLMQITGSEAGRFDVERLVTDADYNLEAGVKALAEQWTLCRDTLHAFAVAEETDPWVLENWRAPLIAYHGYAEGSAAKAATVLSHLANPPAELAAVLWPVTVTDPSTVLPGYEWRTPFTASNEHSGHFIDAEGAIHPATVHLSLLAMSNAPAAPGAAPAAVSGLEPVPGNVEPGPTIDLAWDSLETSGATGYDVEFDSSADGLAWTTDLSATVGDPALNVWPDAAKTRFRFRARGTNSAGTGSWSEYSSFTVASSSTSALSQASAAVTVSKPSVVWKAASSSNYTNSSRTAANIDTIVIHTTEGSYAGAVSWFQNPSAKVSGHYVLGPNGEITQMVDISDVAYTQTYYNSRAIGIECAGYASKSSTWTSALLNSLEHLVAWLCQSYGVKASQPAGTATNNQKNFTGTGIVGHYQIQPWNKTDPGKYFPWSTFIANVNARMNGAGTGGGGGTGGGSTVSAPSAPTSLSPDGGTQSGASVTLSWSSLASSSVTGYECEIQYGASSSSMRAYHTYSPSTNTQTFWPQVDATSYRYRARGQNAGGFGAWSNWASFYYSSSGGSAPSAPLVPPAPTSLSPSSGTITTASAALSWSSLSTSGVTGYELVIEYGSTSSSYAAYATLTPSTNSQTLWPVTDPAYYRFKVRGQNSTGWGAYSSWAGFYYNTVPAAPTPTAAPTPSGLSPSGGGTEGGPSVVLSWTSLSSQGVTGYEAVIEYGPDNSTWKGYYTYSLTTNSKEFWPQIDPSYYRFRVRARNASGWGAYSTWAGFYFSTAAPSAPAPTVPNAPSALVPTGAATESGSSVMFGWSDESASGVTDYELAIEYGPNNSTWSPYVTYALTTNSKQMWPVVDPSYYRFRVRAKNAVGWGGYSSWTGFSYATAASTPTPAPTVPPAPTGLQPGGNSVQQGASVTMSWSDLSSANATGYEVSIENGSDNATWSSYVTYTPTTASKVFWPVADPSYYRFRVRAQNSVGWGGYSDWSVFYFSTSGSTPPSASSVPPAPTLLSPSGGTKSSESVTLSWKDLSAYGATEYEVSIEYGSTTASYAYYYSYVPSTNSKTFWPQSNNRYYRFRVRAKNSSGYGAWSGWSSFYYQK